MSASTRRAYRGRLTDHEKDKVLFTIIEQLDNLSTHMEAIKARVVQPTGENDNHNVAKAVESTIGKGRAAEQAYKQPNHPPNLVLRKDVRVDGPWEMPQFSLVVRHRELLDWVYHKPQDMVGNITKKGEFESEYALLPKGSTDDLWQWQLKLKGQQSDYTEIRSSPETYTKFYSNWPQYMPSSALT